MSRATSDEILRGFADEVESYLPSLAQGIESLKREPDQHELIKELHRLVHTIKGAASLMGIFSLSHIAHPMEEALQDLINGELAFTDEIFRVMSSTIDHFKSYSQGMFEGGLDEQGMLRETVLGFRRVRGLPVEDDADVLKLILESIPQPEDDTPQSGERIRTELFAEQGGSGLSPEIMEEFNQEAEEHLEDVGRFLNTLESQISEPTQISASQREIIGQLRRSVHTLKGAAAVVGVEEVSSWAHEMEDLLDWLCEKADEISPRILTVLLESADVLAALVAKPETVNPSKAYSIKVHFQEIMGQVSMEAAMGDLSGEIEPLLDVDEILGSEDIIEVKVPDAPEPHSREEMVRDLPAQTTKTLRVGMERVDELVNLAGELIIALSGFEQKMDSFSDVVHEIELSRSRLREAARKLEVGYEVKAIQTAGGRVNLPVASAGGVLHETEFEEFDALELDRYSEFNLIIRTLTESVVDVGAISTQLANLLSDFDASLTRQQVLLSELQDKMMRIRMTPMATITNRMHRTVREVAGNLGKKVKLVIRGEGIELDRVIWEKITDPLMHLLRNAVDHGIEEPDSRQAQEKSPVGTIQVVASREGNQVVIRIMDDGAGLNYQAIRRSARNAGLSDKLDEMTDDELASFIFHAGLSTRDDISEVSGRGVGLDVVHKNIQDLKGTIKVLSWPGRGTQFIIRIPLTLATVRALLFSAGGRILAMALNEIREIVRIDPTKITTEPDEVVRIGDEVFPLFHVAKILQVDGDDEAPVPEGVYPLVLVVECGGKRGALVVDSLVGQQEIVIKNLGSHIRYTKGISGATIRGDGSVVPILNTEELLGVEDQLAEALIPDQAFMPGKPLNILVVDDSVSIRQVVSALMESQGWKSETAKDGIEALEKISEEIPDLILLDLEMPRMNGYDLMNALKAQPRLQDIPVVVITSRTAAKHREKARALGAKGFVVKPYDEDELIDLIWGLTGRGEQ